MVPIRKCLTLLAHIWQSTNSTCSSQLCMLSFLQHYKFESLCCDVFNFTWMLNCCFYRKWFVKCFRAYLLFCSRFCHVNCNKLCVARHAHNYRITLQIRHKQNKQIADKQTDTHKQTHTHKQTCNMLKLAVPWLTPGRLLADGWMVQGIN